MSHISSTAQNVHAEANARVQVGNTFYFSRDPCLQALSTTDPELDKERIEHNQGGLLDDVYQWVLHNKEFQHWLSSEDGLLWIQGDPGKGKTMLLCGIINELKKYGVNLSYFFCQATDDRINSATAVLRGLLYMLISKEPYFLRYVQEKYDLIGSQLFEDVNAWFALSNIFKDILNDINLRPSYLIVDALDECIIDRTKLLDLIVSSSTQFRIKWIVSSRNWPIIEKYLGQAAGKIGLRLELNETSISAAVAAYINIKVDKLAQRNKYNDNTKHAVRGHLSSNAHGTFLWVALVCRVLDNISDWEAVKSVKEFPAELNPFYQRMMGEIYTSENAALCRSILAVASVVYRPITLDELVSFFDLSPELCGNDKAIKEIIKFCGSFLAIRDDNRTIYFVHQSAKDFICDPSLNTHFDIIFCGGMQKIHYALFLKSLEQLSQSKVLHRDMYDLLDLGTLAEDVIAPTPDRLAPVKYSCIYWADHLFNAGQTYLLKWADNLQDTCQLYTFLRTKCLYWLEALSLLHEVPKGVWAIRGLTSFIQRIAEGSQLDYLLRDTHRFIMSHRWIIEHAPLQIYTSALLFTPTKSLTRRFFEEERPKWIIDQSIEKEEWGPCVSTLEGHTGEVYSIACSADGIWIASSSKDSIRVWDLATATCIAKLEEQPICDKRLHFSDDGRQIVVVSAEGGFVQIWRWGEDENITITKAIPSKHGDSFVSVIFSDDEKFIASATRDNTITLWSWDRGVIMMLANATKYTIATLNDNDIFSLAFSTTLEHIILVLGDGTLNVLNRVGDALMMTATSALPIAGLERHLSTSTQDFVASVAFSSDRKYIALATCDDVIRVWDWDWNINAKTTTTAMCIAALERHSSHIASIAFSNDGKYIASASWDCTVNVWDWGCGGYDANGNTIATANARKCIATFEGHGCCVQSVIFSADDKWIVSASKDSTIKIWGWDRGTNTMVATAKPTTCKCVAFVEAHSSAVTSIAFSIDGKYVASASSNGIIKVWDAATTLILATFDGHHSHIHCISFSADGKYIALQCKNGFLGLWDFNRCANPMIPHTTISPCCYCIKLFEAYSNCIHSIIFSTDGRYIALALNNGTIVLWHWNGGANGFKPKTPWPTTAIMTHNIATTCKCVVIIERNNEPDNDYTGDPIVFSADGTYIISVSSSGSVHIWGYGEYSDDNDITQITITTRFESTFMSAFFAASANDIKAVACSAVGKYIALAMNDGTIEVWDWGCVVTTIRNVVKAPCKRRAILRGYNRYGSCEEVTLVVFSANGKYIASGSKDGSIRVWDWDATDAIAITDAKCMATLQGNERLDYSVKSKSIAFSADSKLIFSALSDGSIKVWRWGGDDVAAPTAAMANGMIPTCKCLATHERHRYGIRSIIFSADGAYIASASDDNTIKVWSWNTTTTAGMVKCVATHVGHRSDVGLISFSLDGKYIASVSSDDIIKVWGTTTAECRVTIEFDGGVSPSVYLVALSTHGEYIAVASEDDTVTIWDLGDNTINSIYEHLATIVTGHLSRMSFSSNGTCLDTDRYRFELQPPPLSNKPKNAINSTIPVPCMEAVHIKEYGVSKDNAWITCQGHNVLWLPSAYRPVCHAVHGSVVALGCSTGLLWLIEFP